MKAKRKLTDGIRRQIAKRVDDWNQKQRGLKPGMITIEVVIQVETGPRCDSHPIDAMIRAELAKYESDLPH
jgi:hypothetical protein